MFVRKKKNRSGFTSVDVVSKSHRGFKEVKNFGVTTSEKDAEALCAKAKERIRSYGGQQEKIFRLNGQIC